MRKALVALLIFPLSGCSIYKSAVRKDFESSSEGRVQALAPAECGEIGAFPMWWQREFPDQAIELLLSEADVEVWKYSTAEGSVILRRDRPSENGFETCTREFVSEDHFRNLRHEALSDWDIVIPD